VWPVLWSVLCRGGGGRSNIKSLAKQEQASYSVFPFTAQEQKETREARGGETERGERKGEEEREGGREGESETGRGGGGGE
jgi:hypothetical protein